MKTPSPSIHSVACCTALVAAMLVAMAVLDVPAAAWVHRQNFPSAVRTGLRVVRLPGQYGFTVVVAVLMVWRFRHHWRAAVALLCSGAVASAITAVLKWCCGRTRPFRGHPAFDWRPFGPLDTFHTRDLSFPSGDATLAFATAAVIAATFTRYRGLAYGWAIAVGVTRVLQGMHYPSDVLAGAIVGLTTTAVLLRTSLNVERATVAAAADDQPPAAAHADAAARPAR